MSLHQLAFLDIDYLDTNNSVEIVEKIGTERHFVSTNSSGLTLRVAVLSIKKCD